MPTYREAYMLMTYTSDDGLESEQVYNSRDGRAPEIITLRSGTLASHTGPDTYEGPGWAVPAGTRLFVDATPELLAAADPPDGSAVYLGAPGVPYLLDH
jgi:hypothetical protein